MVSFASNLAHASGFQYSSKLSQTFLQLSETVGRPPDELQGSISEAPKFTYGSMGQEQPRINKSKLENQVSHGQTVAGAKTHRCVSYVSLGRMLMATCIYPVGRI